MFFRLCSQEVVVSISVPFPLQPEQSQTDGIIMPAEPGLPPKMSFTSSDYASPKALNLLAPNDGIATGDRLVTATLTTSSLTAPYSGLQANVVIKIMDKDSAGLEVHPPELEVKEGGLAYEIAVNLTSQPTAPVVVELQDPTNQLQFTPYQLIFLPGSGTTPQKVTCGAVDDAIVEGEMTVDLQLLASSPGDPMYNGLTEDVPVSVIDNDEPGVLVVPRLLDLRGLDQGAILLSVNTKPTKPVKLELGPLPPKVSLNKDSVIFDPATDWEEGEQGPAFKVRHANDVVLTLNTNPKP